MNKLGHRYYTQNDEERVFTEYFGDFKGVLVDIGANDGKTFSNSYRLIENGWVAHLVEPHKEAFEKCVKEHADHERVVIHNVAISKYDGEVEFLKGSDSLLSTLNTSMVALWPNVQFEVSKTKTISWASFMKKAKIPRIDFLSIDAEGSDWDILQQINLSEVRMLCIEAGDYKGFIIAYAQRAGMRLIHRTHENLIFAR